MLQHRKKKNEPQQQQHNGGAAAPIDALGLSLPLELVLKANGSDIDSSTTVDIEEHIRLTLRLGGLDLRLTTETQINETSLALQTLGSVFGNNSKSDLACLLMMFNGGVLNITELNITLPLLELLLSCDSCDSKLDLEIISQRLSNPLVIASLQNAIDAALMWISKPNNPVLNLVNTFIDQQIANAPSNCSVFQNHSHTTPQVSTPEETEVIAVVGGFVGCLILVFIISILCCNNRKRRARRRKLKARSVSFDVVSIGADGKKTHEPFFRDAPLLSPIDENAQAEEDDDNLHSTSSNEYSDDASSANASAMKKSKSHESGLSRPRVWTGSLADNLTLDITESILDREERRVRARTLSGSGLRTVATTTGTTTTSSSSSNSDTLTKPLLDVTRGQENDGAHADNNNNDGPGLAVVEKSKSWSICVHGTSTVLANFGIPFLLIINLGLFISAHTTVGAAVDAVITIAHINTSDPTTGGVNNSAAATEIILSGLYDFSLGDSISNMWNAKVYPLALLIAVFSGAWPYVKILLMLFAWFVPDKVFNATRRGHLLQALDALGKWSLIDN